MQKHTERERERQRERERKRECERCVEEEEDDERGGGGGIDSILHTDRDRRHFDSDARFVRFDFLLFCFCFCLFVCLFVFGVVVRFHISVAFTAQTSCRCCCSSLPSCCNDNQKGRISISDSSIKQKKMVGGRASKEEGVGCWDFIVFFVLFCFWLLLLLLLAIHMTWRICVASKAVPGRRTTGAETWPDSTQIMLGYSSSPKSCISRAFSIHGFHTTAPT